MPKKNNFLYVFSCGCTARPGEESRIGHQPVCSVHKKYTAYRIVECCGVDGYKECGKIFRVKPTAVTTTRCPSCQELQIKIHDRFARSGRDVTLSEFDFFDEYGDFGDEAQQEYIRNVLKNRLRSLPVPKVPYTPMIWLSLRNAIKMRKGYAT